MTGDYAAIEIFSYKDFKQVGEYFGRLGMMYKLSDILKEIIREIHKRSNGRVIVGIETNFEKSIVENLLLDTDNTFDYESTLYRESDKDEYGIVTKVSNRDLMISEIYQLINDNPKCIVSKELINEISSLEQKANGRIEAPRNMHDDAFMASALCAYMRRKTLLQYMPLIEQEPEVIEKENNDFLKDIISHNMMFDDPRIEFEHSGGMFRTEQDIDDLDNYDEYSSYLVL